MSFKLPQIQSAVQHLIGGAAQSLKWLPYLFQFISVQLFSLIVQQAALQLYRLL